jgi:N6-adenosine-specific RNA methylase IME4
MTTFRYVPHHHVLDYARLGWCIADTRRQAHRATGRIPTLVPIERLPVRGGRQLRKRGRGPEKLGRTADGSERAMRKQAKLLANFLGATKELTSEYAELAEITESELNQISFTVMKRDDRKTTAKMLSAKGLSTREIAEVTGWSHVTIANDLKAAVKALTKTVQNCTPASNTAAREKTQQRQTEIAEAANAEGVTDEPPTKYRIIYADPPWSYGDTILVPHRKGLPAGEADEHYPTKDLAAICALPVKDWAEDNAVLFLWVPAPMVAEAFEVVKAWGFKYKATFVWDKIKHNMGHYNSVRHEFLYICTRGSCEPDKRQLFDSVQSIERGKHSEKPVKFYDIIETLYTHGRKLEMFARGRREGWDVYGHVAQIAEAAE